MTLRFLIALLVFVGAFALGLFGTYALISRNAGQGIHAVPRPEAGGATQKSEARGADEPAPALGAVQVAAAPAQAAPSPLHPMTAEAPHAAAPVPDAKLGTLDDTRPAAQELTGAPSWWSGLVGKRCVVLLGDVGFSALSVRDGEIADGDRVDWGGRFGKSRKVGSVRASKGALVQLEALGFGTDGTPNAALVTVLGRKKPVRGVISLQVEGKQVRLEPASDSQAAGPSP